MIELVTLFMLFIVLAILIVLRQWKEKIDDGHDRIAFLEQVLLNVEKTVFKYDLPMKGGWGTSGAREPKLGHSLTGAYRPSWKQPRSSNGRFR